MNANAVPSNGRHAVSVVARVEATVAHLCLDECAADRHCPCQGDDLVADPDHLVSAGELNCFAYGSVEVGHLESDV